MTDSFRVVWPVGGRTGTLTQEWVCRTDIRKKPGTQGDVRPFVTMESPACLCQTLLSILTGFQAGENVCCCSGFGKIQGRQQGAGLNVAPEWSRRASERGCRASG